MNRNKALLVSTASVLVAGGFAPSHSLAHHALIAFDSDRVIEVRGVLEDVFWANPHVRFRVRTADDTVWDLEGTSVNRLERLSGIRRESFTVGEEVVFTGLPSRRDAPRMRPILARLSSGQALAMERGSVERFGLLDEIAEPPAVSSELIAEATRNANGIFRVWTAVGRTQSRPSDTELPLTNTARAAKESWTQEDDDLALQCIPAGLPEAMLTPFPMEILDMGDTIEIRMEEWDNVRTVHMRGDAGREDQESREDREGQAPSHLGYSVGRWQDGALAVSTSEIDHPFMDDVGTPLSGAAEIIERFQVSEDETRLDWSATVLDPETFTEPVALPVVHFEWWPETRIKPYNCTVYPG